jgi:hypothetical protein
MELILGSTIFFIVINYGTYSGIEPFFDTYHKKWAEYMFDNDEFNAFQDNSLVYNRAYCHEVYLEN